MPERVKIKFDDESPPEIIDTGKKRTATEAFGPAKPAILARHRQKPSNGSNKVITFSDDKHDKDSKATSNFSAKQKLATQPQPPGRLQQRAAELLEKRQQLPIWTHEDEILNKVKNNDVLLLVGETGSGKSTQIPQFLLSLCQRTAVGDGPKVGGRIAITQPRRVAAISLARRVAEEMGTPLGKSSPASEVGYSVRFDNNTSPSTRVKFVTDGTLLQELVRDPWLKEYSVIVVDEVHERGVNVDLVLGFLKRMIDGRNKKDGRGGKPLKVVVMSATADMERIQSFFGSDQTSTLQQPPNGQQHDTPDGVDETSKLLTFPLSNSKIASCYIKGRQYPVTTHYVSFPVTNVLDAALERIIDIHKHAPLPGDILVFLPGQETIDTLESMCIAYSMSLLAKSKEKGAPRLPRLLVLPLFAALPTATQQRVFDSTPPFTRKIILSTNIAETSVTVPGIRHVIDTGKRKARFFRPGLNLDTLLTKAISRSSANQRAGRAGREAAGNCYRLYTEKTFYELEADTEPEMLRCDLSQLVLVLKSHNVDNILGFPLLTPPPEKSLKRALLTLLRLKALARKDGQITKLGRKMSTLPLPANLARVLLASQLPQYDCLEEIIDIVSGLSVETIWLPIHNTVGSQRIDNPWTNSESFHDNDATHKQADNETRATNGHTHKETDHDEDEDNENPIIQARSTLYRREGDHLTLLAAIQAYAQENSDRKEWCRRHATSHRAMNSAMDVRKQLRKLFLEGGNKYKLDKPSNTANSKATKPKQNNSGNHKAAIDSDTTESKEGTLNNNNSVNNDQIPTHRNDLDKNTRILRVLLLGLADNIAYLNPHPQQHQPSKSQSQSSGNTTIWTGPYTTLSSSLSSTTASGTIDSTEGGGGTSRKNLQIHPSSTLFSRMGGNRPAWIMFSEFVVTGRAYARCVSAIESAWVDEIIDGGQGDEEDE